MLLDDSILVEFPFHYREFTGAVEHTELTDVDRAVGSFFQEVLDTLCVVDRARKENEEFARYCDKPKKHKLFGGEFLNPQDFLQKLTAKTGAQIKAERNELLPTAYITRDPVISFPMGDAYIDITGCGELNYGDGTPFAKVNKSFVTLAYTVTTVAWNKSTLARMSLGVMMWTRHQKKGRKHVFQAQTMLADTPIAINIELVSVKDAMAEPAEIDHENTRLYSSTIRFEVIAEVYEAEELVEKTGRVEIGEGYAIE
ncbi:TPA: hypothetical protein N2826_003985 [Vibrio parahaemolyticus]|uniref:hypothetical protein n=1 Tax=Vibrio parahaemolyticus TaxID=670 RepID=UPI00111F1742|nr:hypothetical protein [Vibrio parahaemolyticus]MBE4286453.1 hypothetical protein [Vibrio parahaemolyticus]TOH18945.1 hypothetical protein CGI90_04300 [Vibrio parahaemolyticus]HCM0798024.1 hypothetical protein [Vibrio parahaemolyticus]HCM0883502.1 hypothetical protein [Vibrio parahaemolyticus]HCM1326719.1 hypothetical protein [Vibrio parahaemolyticus]